MVREIKIENDVRHLAKEELDIESIKLNLSGNRGWPDVLFMFDGNVFFMEFKAPEQLPRELQVFRLRWLHDHGFHAQVCDNVYDGMEALKKWKQSILGNDSLK